MRGLIRSVLGWFGLGGVADFAVGAINFVERGLTGDVSVERAEIDADVQNRRTEADRQKAQFQFPMFWVIAVVFLGPLALKWGMINLYDVFWCRGCMFPQPWTIAAYQAPFDDWARSAFQWVFGPVGAVGLAGGVGIGLVTRGRK
ncbi:hypothetical protein PSC71_08295 [Devosia sp. J2-20]|uniref:hypothetical protein n=1 Tax=Devosia sp. J2-20 TaxID=3026161 RepID=UPI00249B3B34|nr:hypothetical protein [Devosia sp. J2-20]WDR00733.1 hypothetical protein PSC71_08295 [Devosia sp. J2-20]